MTEDEFDKKYAELRWEDQFAVKWANEYWPKKPYIDPEMMKRILATWTPTDLTEFLTIPEETLLLLAIHQQRCEAQSAP